jgi:SAM-dependent methyltransferase
MIDNFAPKVDYDHRLNLHSVSGARATLQRLFAGSPPRSVLDIGCGTGTWLRAALDLGVSEVYGVDGVPIEERALLIPEHCFEARELSKGIDLGRKFDIALCLEVGEHLPADAAPTLIASLVKHADAIMFSAAAPGQSGQHHVNCQWPDYWQEMFNANGYMCNDIVRWIIWDDADIEPWYRQNMFTATRAPDAAPREARIRPVVHPAMFDVALAYQRQQYEQYASEINSGIWPVSSYVSLLRRAVVGKLKRKSARFFRAA